MAVKIVYPTTAQKIEQTLAAIRQPAIDKMDIPDATFTADELVPVILAIRDVIRLAGKLDETTTELDLRLKASETAVINQTNKPASDFATALDKRMEATSNLLRATLHRMDQIEASVIRIYKTPFLAIDANDKPRKELSKLKAAFDVVCPEKN